jgi:hypothetical protein
VDSDDPGGPAFGWIDISAVGTEVPLGDDAFAGPFGLGFAFPFYENSYSDLYIGSNGIVTFGVGSGTRLNTNLPEAGLPNNLVALWWDDLDPRKGGHIYYYADAVNQRFVVSFVEIKNYLSTTGTGSLTFQMVVYPNGRLVLQYQTMDPGTDADGLTGATVGIENGTGTDGLAVVYNGPYMHDSLAISLKASRWLMVHPGAGVIEPYSSATVQVAADAAELVDGVYSGQVTVSGNDPANPTALIPVGVTVQSFVCGDANGDGLVNVADVVYLINYSFKGGPPPVPLLAGDANGDAAVNVADAVFLINYVFKQGPSPRC